MEWFSEAKFGIFIHWGIYSVPAYDDIDSARNRKIGNGSEWYKGRLTKTFRVGKGDISTKNYHKENYGDQPYDKFMDSFYGRKFDPDKWCKLFKKVGAKYIVLTAKHHDGFCMWDTKTTDNNVMNTPMKRDVLKELMESAKRYDLKFGIYFSWMEFGKNISNKFMNMIVKPQLEELKTYKPDLWWMDGDWVTTNDKLDSDKFVKDIHKMGAIINSRLGKGSKGGDYDNFMDRFIPDKKMDKVFESCYTIGLSWGHNKMQEKEDYKSVDELFDIYTKVTSRNGNFLLNIAPDSDGKLDKIEKKRLEGLGEKIKGSKR